MDHHPGLGESSEAACPFMTTSESVDSFKALLVQNPSAILPLLSSHLKSTWTASNAYLRRVDPLLLVIFSVSVTILGLKLLRLLRAAAREIHEKGIRTAVQVQAIFILKKIPGVAEKIRAEQEKMVKRVTSSLASEREERLRKLPLKGLSPDQVTAKLDALNAGDKKWEGKCSGTVYIGGASFSDHWKLTATAYSRFAHTNPLHPDTFPSVVRMESEVIAMTAGLLGAGEDVIQSRAASRWSLPDAAAGTEEVCGSITSGGTESILMAVKTARDYMWEVRGITEPEMVMAESAHPAYNKACKYLGVMLRVAPVGPDLRANVKAMKSLISRNTIMIVGSAPGFPHGVIDDIEALSDLALRFGTCLHVDCCLGGFVLPFAKKLGYPIPAFDFRLPGVTSISVDTHKYGLAPKGTSVILYRTRALKRFQYVAVTDWTGGMYVSPTVAGSRSGGLVAGAWASLIAQGEEGFMDSTDKLMVAARRLRKGVEAIEGIRVLGEPDMTLVAFGTRPIADDVYKINDAMSARGWSLNALQSPPSVHMCITLQHIDAIDKFLEDLEDSAEEVRKNPKAFMNGMAPVYGAAAKIPDRVAVGDFLITLMDSL